MSELAVERLVLLDEGGITTKMARTHARALWGNAPMALSRSARGSG
jgi:hypothetical protein